jgi:biopolymer transport protein TolR
MSTQNKPTKSTVCEVINVTPLIDVLLVLLIIFMVISPFRTQGLDTRIPQVSSQPASERNSVDTALVISVAKDFSLKLNQEKISRSELAPKLREIFKTRTDRTLFLQGDSGLLYSEIAEVLDIAKGAGGERIGLLTRDIH